LAREAPFIPDQAADDCARKVADMMGVLFDAYADGGRLAQGRRMPQGNFA